MRQMQMEIGKQMQFLTEQVNCYVFLLSSISLKSVLCG
jgi:hypothetical protein